MFLETFAVPEPVRVPAPEITSAAAGVKVPLELTVKFPLTAKFPEPVTAALEAIVRSWNDKVVPELTMLEPLFMVIVPEEGLRTAVELLVRAPSTPKLVFAVTVAAEATVRLKKVRVVPELTILEPLFMVMVPEVG